MGIGSMVIFMRDNYKRFFSSKKFFFGLCILILILSFFFHIYRLELRPVHHDEGVNGWFMDRLIESGRYSYSPKHYHGPTFFYLGMFSSKIFGLSTFSIRFVAAFFGFLLSLSPLLVRKELGKEGTIAGILLLAFTPAILFYSRYAIHEILFICFTTYFAVFSFLYLFYGKNIYLVLSPLALAFAAASKETVVINLFGIFIGLLLAIFISKEIPWEILKKRIHPKEAGFFIIVLLIGLLIWFKKKELIKFFNSYLFYAKLGTITHKKPWNYFFQFLFRSEWFLMVGGVLGGIAAIWRKKSFGLFCLGWAVSVTIIYSSIQYKTPWLLINLLVPLAFLFSSLFSEMNFLKKNRFLYISFLMIIFLFASITFYKSYLWNYKESTEPENPYLYVHTYPSTHVLEKRIKNLLDLHQELRAEFVTPEHWPFRFLMRDYKKRVFFKSSINRLYDKNLVIARIDQHDEVIKILSNNYLVEDYDMRPGVKLQLFINPEFL